jgi:hypothetical protein
LQGIFKINPAESSNHAKGLVNPEVLAKKPDFRFPRACRFRIHQIKKVARDPSANLLKKRDFYFIKWAKIGKI